MQRGGIFMAINSISLNKVAANVTSPVVSSTDTETKSIQNQITNKQQSLKRLTSDTEMSAEEKAKEQQEIRKQIAELNRKLRMLRLEKQQETKELQKEEEQKAALREKQNTISSSDNSDEDISIEETKELQEKISISPQDVHEILEAGIHIQKERIQQSVDQSKTSSENILSAEIHSDRLYGTDTSAKEEKLSELIRKEPFEMKTKETQKQETQKKPMKIVIREDDILL